MSMKTSADIIKEQMLNEYISKKAASTPVNEEVKATLFKATDPKEIKERIEYEDITGYKLPEGEKRYWPKSIMHEVSDWPEALRSCIPTPNVSHVPDPEFTCGILDGIAYNKIVMAFGKPGCGKDSEIKWLCGRLNIPYEREDGMEGIDVMDIVGSYIPDGKGGFVEMKQRLWLFAEHGGVYVRSEPFACSAGVNFAVQKIMESERLLSIPGHPDPTKATLKAHPKFRMMLTSNVRGTGDDLDKYAATTVQDVSSLNRVDIFLSKDYMSAGDEVRMLMNYHKDMTKELAKKMVQLGNEIRRGWDMGKFAMAWSPRQLLGWADTAMRDGSVVRGFKQCYYNSLNDDERGHIKGLWRDVDFGEDL